VGRGDLLADADGATVGRRELDATVCWLGDAPAHPGSRYLLKHTTRTVRARIESIEHRLDVETLAHVPAPQLALNDIARVRVRTGDAVLADPYDESRATGAFILVDEATNETVGAGMVAG
jgi:sulfate adenylyltransferase subunit 1